MLFKGHVHLGPPLSHGASASGFFGPLLPIGMSTVYTCFLEITQKLNKPRNAGYQSSMHFNIFLLLYSKGNWGIRINTECSSRPRRKSYKNGWVGRRTTSPPKFTKQQRALWLVDKNWSVVPIVISSLNGFAFLDITGTKQMPPSFSLFPSIRK